MNKCDLIKKLEKEIKSKETKIRYTNNKLMKSEYASDINLISWEIKVLKNLNGETVKFCEGLSGQLLHEQYKDQFKYNFCPKCGLNLSPE